MKWIAKIVAVCFLTVSFSMHYRQPVLRATDHSEVPRCAEKSAPCCDKPASGNKEQKRSCGDPQMECSFCLCQTIVPATFSFHIFRNVVRESMAGNIICVVAYHASFWHPPQNV
jgi:hypothetical protein